MTFITSNLVTILPLSYSYHYPTPIAIRIGAYVEPKDQMGAYPNLAEIPGRNNESTPEPHNKTVTCHHPERLPTEPAAGPTAGTGSPSCLALSEWNLSIDGLTLDFLSHSTLRS